LDTGTHFVAGLGLAGLAYIDPAVAADPSTALAVMAGTVLGSQAPDADGLLRLRGNGLYIRNHRGISHSVPALFVWTFLITGAVKIAIPSADTRHLALWILIAVALHVISDLFNAYGTQAFRPFSERWVSWNIIHIFDPFIFTSHAAAIVLWAVGADPRIVFPALYALLIVYYAWRSRVHARLTKLLSDLDGAHRPQDRYLLIPTVNLNQWNVVKTVEPGRYVLGELKDRNLQWVDEMTASKHPAAEASRHHPDIAAFLYFSSYACPEVRPHPWGYEVRWIDVRYRHRKQYPFLGVLLMDKSYQPLDSYVGWLNEERVEKRLRINTY
jgi:inner membrane protein